MKTEMYVCSGRNLCKGACFGKTPHTHQCPKEAAKWHTCTNSTSTMKTKVRCIKVKK